ncbi:ParB N-terminal domain-containing protein [Photobacterium piscicola]|uniref:ParB N-terminal domain-containing protein n=1 Tax=Photobacterium piscicola TaxID=1378299 RepID=UPI002E191070|nr:ParB N-terminal domain-containing protein [Photobacterium piscicola]
MNTLKSNNLLAVTIKSIIAEEVTQFRDKSSQSQLTHLNEVFQAGETLDPIEVMKATDVTNGTYYYLIDGFHRTTVHVQNGADYIDAIVVGEGTKRDARRLARKANAITKPRVRRNQATLINCIEDAYEELREEIANNADIKARFRKMAPQELADLVALKPSSQLILDFVERYNTSYRRVNREQFVYNSISNSEYTKEELADLFEVSPEQIEAWYTRRAKDRSSNGPKGPKPTNTSSGTPNTSDNLQSSEPDDTTEIKNPIYQFIDTPKVKEAKLRNYLSKFPSSIGENPRQEQWVNQGRVDILTDTSIVELKIKLDEAGISKAILQLMHYSQSIDNHRLILAGGHHKDLDKYLPALQSFGFEVISIDINTYNFKHYIINNR